MSLQKIDPPLSKPSGFVAVHEERGIYLGNYCGIIQWSYSDPQGSAFAVVFPDKEEALRFFEKNFKVSYKVEMVPIIPSLECEVSEHYVTEHYATVEDCVGVGLFGWDWGKRENDEN